QPSARTRTPLASGVELNNRYRVVKAIGAGGFSYTYLCEHIRNGALVAIKEGFPSDAASRLDTGVAAATNPPAFGICRQGLMGEMVAAARAAHPNVVRVEDAFEANGTLYYAMEFVEGETISELVARSGDLSLDTVRAVAIDLTNAIDHLHGVDILHGDLKPQ